MESNNSLDSNYSITDSQCPPLTGNGQVGAPTSTYLVTGSNQNVVTNQKVPQTLIMQVADADGDSVPNISVNWTIFRGTGEVSQVMTRTNQNGCSAALNWIVGPELGVQQVRAEIGGLAPIYFLAQVSASSAGGLVQVSGQNQEALIGLSLALPIVYRVVDQNQQALSGRRVLFNVTQGQSTLSANEIVSDVNGLVRLNTWTMPAQPGPQTLRLSLLAQDTDTVVASTTIEATATAAGTPRMIREVLIGGLSAPWDLAFTSTGEMFYTERIGRISVRRNGVNQVLVSSISDLNQRTQSGLLGIAVDPLFEQNRFVYTFISSQRSGSMDNRIRRWLVAPNFSSMTEDRDILTGITWGSDGAHSGGRIRFGSDGYLYVVTGDTRSATVPQDRRVLGGKVIRITRDGNPAPGNPTPVNGNRPEISMFGFRNIQGIAFRPQTNQGFLCEHGPQSNDEVTMITPGGNGGWDPNDGAGNYSGYSGPMGAPMTDLIKFPTATRPSFVLADAEGIAGCDFISGPQWGTWDGMLAVASLAGARIIFVTLSANGQSAVGPAQQAFAGQSRIRGVTQGPDGLLYVVTDASPNGEIWRVSP